MKDIIEAKLFLDEFILKFKGGFNPDTPFEDYITKEGFFVYGVRQARMLNKKMGYAFDMFRGKNECIYDYVINKLEGNA